MQNSEYILRTLDANLKEPLPFTLHLLGGAAMDLVYELPRFSEDVDIMCTMDEGSHVDSPEFVSAIAQSNAELEKHGLYVTHIFDENSLVHTDNWIDCVVEPRHSAPKFSNFHYDALLKRRFGDVSVKTTANPADFLWWRKRKH